MDIKFMNNPFAVSWRKKLEKLHPKTANIKVQCACHPEDEKLLAFWSEKISIRNDKEVVRVNGEHYMISTSAQKGFGGKKWKIEFEDERVVETDNLWHQGQIPESYRQVLPDNAKFV